MDSCPISPQLRKEQEREGHDFSRAAIAQTECGFNRWGLFVPSKKIVRLKIEEIY
jgi:hypothetical protein